ncbi:hypothetical protein AM571_PB00247 (plasmid) [Rhizobium etli 8C-3]|uniref:Uncharacterized protein n=1 Tax=Rhizobium etli 8C-3 TaxID=538025 RepID=A0A1L5PBM8_RHIET|nr:hypothetical protein AM571_PB00247 [Rhizobium etli 8C-3]EGE56331.1 hypothetical protein RHECNPAF_7150018 [Rhizobium etli CNPAF512]
MQRDKQGVSSRLSLSSPLPSEPYWSFMFTLTYNAPIRLSCHSYEMNLANDRPEALRPGAASTGPKEQRNRQGDT